MDSADSPTTAVRLICRRCLSALDWPGRDATLLSCTCGAEYPCLCGIPDLRTTADPYCGNDRDAVIAADLNEASRNLTFAELLERYYLRHCPELGPADVQRQMRHILEGPTPLERSDQDTAAAVPVLDIGCGAGSGLIAFARELPSDQLIGMDIAMRWLVLARRRLDEAGLGDMRLVCCEGEAMPFTDNAFGTIHGGDVIEHVADAEAVLGETARVLEPGGRALFRTPNRMSLTPEPHVGLPFAGWLPRKWAAGYCRMLGAPPFQGIFTRTLAGWNRAARVVSGRYPEVAIDVQPALVNTGQERSSGLVGLYDAALKRSGAFRAFAVRFGPVLEIRMEKRLERAVTPAGPFREAPGLEQGKRPG
ncbi:methyltransferase domain-containing protein [bacterium]|nr:methyltransferase domain-containing protein [bacterium]